MGAYIIRLHLKRGRTEGLVKYGLRSQLSYTPIFTSAAGPSPVRKQYNSKSFRFCQQEIFAGRKFFSVFFGVPAENLGQAAQNLAIRSCKSRENTVK